MLGQLPSRPALETLYLVATNEKQYYRVRCRAVVSLAQCAAADPSWVVPDQLLALFRKCVGPPILDDAVFFLRRRLDLTDRNSFPRLFCVPQYKEVARTNDFSNLVDYFFQKVRGPKPLALVSAQPACPLP